MHKCAACSKSFMNRSLAQPFKPSYKHFFWQPLARNYNVTVETSCWNFLNIQYSFIIFRCLINYSCNVLWSKGNLCETCFKHYDHVFEVFVFFYLQEVVKEAELLVTKAKQQFLSSSEIKPPKDVSFKVYLFMIN